MPTDSPSSERPKRSRLRRWLRRLLLLSGVLLLILGAVVLYAKRNLTVIAKWAMERAFPGAKVELKALDFTLPGQLDIDSIVLKSRKDGATLLSLGGGSLVFNFDDLWKRQFGEIRLVEPAIFASPRLGEAFSPPPGTPLKKRPGAPWSVRRLVCEHGELTITGYGGQDLNIRMKFSCDFTNFSPANAPLEKHSFALWDLAAIKGTDPFLQLDLVEVSFTFDDILKDQMVSSVSLSGGSLVVGKSLREIFSTPRDPAALPQRPWVFGDLDIRRVQVRIDDERPEISDITFALITHLQNVPLSQTASTVGAEPQTIVLRNLQILSPYDPLTKVVTLERTEFTFTLAGLLKKELSALTVSNPVIYVGQDLFWYMEDAQKRLGTEDGKPDKGPGWKVGMVDIQGGSLVLGSGGRPQYGLPLKFYMYAEDIELDNLATLKLDSKFTIPEERHVFPDYQLEFTGGGDLKFSYPPEKGEKNLVGDIKITDLRWRQYRANDSYVSVTFDKKGINGLFGGKAYKGNTDGGFSFFFDPSSPWIGWISGQSIDLRSLTNVISPQNFQMTGPLNFKMQMDALGKSIERIGGDMQTPKPGKMVIKKLDDMLARIPDSWTLLKQSSTRIALEALRDFNYDKGSGNFWFVRQQGILQLKLQGPQGSRNFDIVLHADDSPLGRWKKQSAKR